MDTPIEYLRLQGVDDEVIREYLQKQDFAPEKIEKIICEINANPLLDGITFSGGDPLYHPQEFLALVKRIKEST